MARDYFKKVPLMLVEKMYNVYNKKITVAPRQYAFKNTI